MFEERKKISGTTVAFGDVVRLSRETSKDPESDGFERYVGLEHLQPSDLKVRSWGDVGDGTTFTNVFRPGQVLFGKRRAYQRKVAVADFSGVCSGDIYAFEPKDERLLPELLPFICQSEPFYDYVISMSQGGLSPRVNWKALAQYEFNLPPVDEQRRIASVLQTAVELGDAFYNVVAGATTTFDSIINERMRGLGLGPAAFHERVGRYFAGWSLARLGDLLSEAQYGLSETLHTQGQYPVLRMMNLEGGKATASDLKYADLSDDVFEKYRLHAGDVLFNRTNSYELVGRTGVYDLAGDFTFASYLVRLITKPDLILPEYLSAFLTAPIGRRQVMSFATRGVSQANVNASNLRRVLVPLPPVEYQEGLLRILDRLNSSREDAQTRRVDASTLVAGVMKGVAAQ